MSLKLISSRSSGKLRSRRGPAGDDDDFDSLCSSEAGETTCGPQQRVVIGVLCACQFILLLCFAHIWQAQKPPASVGPTGCAVSTLTDETLPLFVASMSNGTLLSFHAPECESCKEVRPEFEAAACELQARGGAPLAHVSVTSAPKAAAKYGVDHFPALLWFRKGHRVLELPPDVRKAAKIVEYVEWLGEPAVWSFGSRADFAEGLPQLRSALRRGAPPVVVGFAGVRPQVRAALEATGEKFRGKMVFLYVEEAAAEGDDPDPALRAYFLDEADDQIFEGSVDPQNVQDWVKQIWLSLNITRP